MTTRITKNGIKGKPNPELCCSGQNIVIILTRENELLNWAMVEAMDDVEQQSQQARDKGREGKGRLT